MSRATPQMRDLAKRVLAHEARSSGSSAEAAGSAASAIDRLRPHLATLVGNGGFRALFLRALALAKAEVPWLRAARLNADATLEGPGKLPVQLAPGEIFEGNVTLLSQLLGLMVAFIGENLTLRLVRQAWPKVPPGDLEPGNGVR